MKKMYCLVVTDDFSRFIQVLFLAIKDETSEILKIIITDIENLIDLRVKVIRCDNGTEFKNRVMNKFCEIKGRKPTLSFIRPFGYLVTILNTIDHLDPPFSSSSKDSPDAGFKPSGEEEKKDAKDPGNERGNPPEGKDSEVPSTKEPRMNQEKDANVNSTNNINTVSPTVNAASIEDNVVDENIVYRCVDDPNIPDLEEIGRFSDAEDDGAEADMTNLDTYIPISPILTTRIHKDHPVEQII
ncbi:putative ribonuclease H-like domain-containing protein [Tanacetum coccineum]